VYDVFIIEVLIKYAKTFLIKLKLAREKISEKNIQAKEIYQKVLQSLRLSFYSNSKKLEKSDKKPDEKSILVTSEDDTSFENKFIENSLSSSEDDTFDNKFIENSLSSSEDDTFENNSSENSLSSFEDEYDDTTFIVSGIVSGDDNSYRFNLETTESFADPLKDNLNLKNLDTQVYFLFNYSDFLFFSFT
jgi:hypothetical protein